MRLDAVRVLLQSNVESTGSPSQVTGFSEGQPQVDVRQWTIMQQGNRLHVLMNSLFRTIHRSQRDAETVVCNRIIRVVLQRFAKSSRSLPPPSSVQIGTANMRLQSW